LIFLRPDAGRYSKSPSPLLQSQPDGHSSFADFNLVFSLFGQQNIPMPIAFACPHCGKQTSVSEQFAGQTGPCAACGKSITVPGGFPGPNYAYAPQGRGGGGAIAVVVAVLALCGLCVVPILIALLLPAVQAAREAGRRAQSQNNLRQLSLGMLNYHDTYGAFPPAVVTDASGQPLYSGRVLLLPYIEQKPLFDQFDLTQRWDSPRNLAISQTTLQVFCDPSSAQSLPGKTDYLFVTGAGTAFEPPGPHNMGNMTDGTSNTLLMVEVRDSGTSWAEPRDLDISQPMSLPQGNHPGINLGAFFDGHVSAISNTIAPEDVRALATKSGNEPVTAW
jgi:hypothetical protein